MLAWFNEFWSGLNRLWKCVTALGLCTAFGLAGLLFFRIFFVTFVDNYELAFSYDKMTGKIERIDERGWVVRTPFRYAIHTLDLRPTQVQISFNQRVLNAMLIQFDPEGLETFLEWHGRTAGDSTSNMHEILKCYAFAPNGGVDCPFLTVVSRLDPSQRFDPEKKEIIRK